MNVAALRTAGLLRAHARDVAAAEVQSCLDRAEQARAAAHAAASAIQAEADHAASVDSGDFAVEAFVAWLPHARHRAALLADRCVDAEGRLAVARAALATARAGMEAIDRMLDRAAAEAAVARARREAATAQETMLRRGR